ncbi:ribbon-helix-helix protein, CopG family [Legionella sp.]|uniref:type II toxin-antitoxin system RelB family antitoxin n=1 Tax=Legionella sp. TaxID=459 RepID=UPI0032205D26
MASASALITVRVSAEIAERLERLAKSVDRSKSYLAAEAIEEYLGIHEWQVQAIQEGLEEIEQGAVFDLGEVKKQLGLSD